MDGKHRMTAEALASLEGSDPTDDIIDEAVDRLVAVGAGTRAQLMHAIDQVRRRNEPINVQLVHVAKERKPLTKSERNRKKAERKAQRIARKGAR